MANLKLPTRRYLAIRRHLLPRDTNVHGTIFGGVILAQIDLAGAVEARRRTDTHLVTVAMREVEFKLPVRLGDVVSFYTRTTHLGRTSIAVKVEVEATRQTGDRRTIRVTEAEVVFVCVDGEGNKTTIVPPRAHAGEAEEE